ncbi:MAG: putative Ig domain-containing protein [Candidatus Acidiferrum sp.]
MPNLAGNFSGTLNFPLGTDNVTATLTEGSGYSLTVQTTLSGADNGNFTFSGSAVANVMFVSGTVDGKAFSLFGYFDSSGKFTGTPNSIVVFDYNTLSYYGMLVNSPAGPPQQAPSITSASSATFTEGQLGSFTVTDSGFPAPTITEAGTLPTGVTFSAGVLKGTPTVSGTFPITFTASNGVLTTATQSFTLTVTAPATQAPSITSATSATFTEGQLGSFTVTATGVPAPTIIESGALPPGVRFSAGVLSGTPTISGQFPISFTASNGVSPTAIQSFMLTVSAPATQAPAITSATNAIFTEGQPGSFTVTASGTPTPTIMESGALPAGVTFSAGVLSGTPTTSGTFPITFTAANGITPNGTQSFSLIVKTPVAQPPSITSANTETFTQGQPGSFTVTAAGVPTPTITESGSLPAGVSFTAGVLSGTPTANGTFPITFNASNGVSPNGTQSFTLTVQQAPAFSSASGATFTEGQLSSFTVTVSGFPTPTITESGTLPAGVAFTAGVLSGTPTASGTFPITFTASNGVTPNGTQSFTLTVNATAFSDASLNGHYAFSFTDSVGRVYSAGSFVADGNGGLSQGVLDFISDQTMNGSSYSNTGISANVSFTGSYQIGTDGRGTLTLVSSLPSNELPSSFDFVMVSTNEGRMISTNVVSVSGALFKQDTSAFSNAAIAGNYAFRQAGEQICGAGGACLLPYNAAGTLTMDGNGNITTGAIYFDNSNTAGPGSLTIAGSYNIGPNGRGTIVFNGTSFPPQNLYTYVISANKMIFVSIGPPDGSILGNGGMAYIGEADLQTDLPFSSASVSGNYTFALSGLAAFNLSLAGQFNATGEAISGEEDSIDEQPVVATDVPFTGMDGVVSTSGFGTMSLSSVRVSYLTFYLVSPSLAFLVSRDSLSADSIGGEAHVQGNGPFTISGNYAFSFGGYSIPSATGGPVSASGQFTSDEFGNIKSGTIDLGSNGSGYPLTGAYSNLDTTGRGTISITTEVGGSPVTFNFVLYANSSSELTLVGVNADVVGSAKRQ